MIASVDLGFGYTKAIGVTTWWQPSVVGEARQLFENSIKPDDVQKSRSLRSTTNSTLSI